MIHNIVEPKAFQMYVGPFFWREKAKELKKSGDLLKLDLDRQWKYISNIDMDKGLDIIQLGPMLHDVCHAMYGFSLECLFKGYILHLHPEYSSNNKLYSKLKTHKLLKLAQLAEFTLSNDEGLFCTNMTEIMEGYRYPVQSESTGKDYFPSYSGDWYGLIFSLYERLDKEIKGYNIFGHDEARCIKCLASKGS